jgi:hypothetical protein
MLGGVDGIHCTPLWRSAISAPLHYAVQLINHRASNPHIFLQHHALIILIAVHTYLHRSAYRPTTFTMPPAKTSTLKRKRSSILRTDQDIVILKVGPTPPLQHSYEAALQQFPNTFAGLSRRGLRRPRNAAPSSTPTSGRCRYSCGGCTTRN